MKTIHKHQFLIGDFVLPLPADAQIVKVDDQNGQHTMWYLFDKSAPKIGRKFIVYGTGHAIEAGVHRATWFSGPFVWHLFEVNP